MSKFETTAEEMWTMLNPVSTDLMFQDMRDRKAAIREGRAVRLPAVRRWRRVSADRGAARRTR